MTDFVFDIAKGRAAYYATLPAASDALIVVPVLAAGLEADATLKDYSTLSALLAGTTDEATSLGRKTVVAGVTVTVDNAGDRVDVDMPDITWAATAGGAIGALIIAYDPDTAGGTDADLIPLVKLDCALTPDGSDFTAVLASSGFYRAS